MNNELLYEPKYLEDLYKLENNTHPEKLNWISKHVHVKKPNDYIKFIQFLHFST